MRENRSIPDCTVIPVLVYEDVAEAVEWLSDTFGFRERLRIGTHRVQMWVGENGAMVVSERRGQPGEGADQLAFRPPRRGIVSHSVMIRVEDVDAHFKHARGNGARIINPPADQPYGERQYAAEDLAGHHWTFTQSIADIDPEEWGGELIEG
jgi:uncharacterized glyoxalase superfamily protein PhnB